MMRKGPGLKPKQREGMSNIKVQMTNEKKYDLEQRTVNDKPVVLTFGVWALTLI